MECENCGRRIDPNIGECRWSDCPGNQVTCPACGAIGSAYDQICTTCWGRGFEEEEEIMEEIMETEEKKTSIVNFFRMLEITPNQDFEGSETVELPPLFDALDHDLTIWRWEDAEGNNAGLIRDDLGGISTLCFDLSREDQLTLAAWNCDVDIRLLELDPDNLELALKDAADHNWGFEGGQNIWDEE